MTTLRSELLSSLKNYSRCNDELAIRVRETVLEPFQVDPSQLKTLKATPSPQEFKQMAVRLAPLAMNIVNQNSETLNRLKKEKPLKGANVVTGNCLIDSSFYALAALRHMNTLTTLKHLDIEKTTSNLISKIVDLGEYGRALYELVKFRLLLASVVKVSLVKQKKTTLPVSGNASRETSDNRIPKDMISNEWEQEMINKYQDLFQFPLDPTIDDPTTILLVLAYQMNTIRCFCEMKGGALAKYIPYLFDASGNFLDWCKLLSPIEPTIAKKQTEVVQKTFLKAFQRYQLNDGTTFYAYTLKCLVLKACLVSNTKKLKAILDNFVQSSLSYEKSNTKTNYQYIHKRCEILLEYIQPDPQDLSELDSYFVFCDFYAYVSRKTKSYQGTFYAFKHMIRPVRDMVGKPNVNSYYYSMYAATAKLSLCSVQMDKMAIDNCYIDVSTTFKETIQCMGLALQVAKEVQVGDNHSADALYHFYETADFFKQSAKRFYEFLREKAIQNVSETSNDPLRTPPRPGEIATPNNFGTWNTVAPQLNETLQVTSDCISSGIELIETKFEHYEKAFEMNTITTTFVEMMILSVRIKYQVEDERSYHQALEYLDKAEKFCSKTNFSKGNSWISSSYYSLGAAMIQLEMYSKATLPIRKSTILLSTHVESNPTDKNKLELCNRYEALGTCCFKVNEFREARESYRIALRQIPISKIKLFIDKGNSKAVSAISEEETLLPKLMDRFLRASIVDPNQASVTYACEHLQLSSFNDAEQCILFECELRVWSVLSLKANLSKFQLHIVNQLLEIYTPDIYPLRRIRVLLEQVRIERSKTNDRNGCLKKALECAVEAHELLKLKEYKKDVLLLYYRRHYLALSTSWIAICGYELQGKASYSFKIPFDHWNVLLRNIPTVYDSPTQISPKDKQKIYDEIDDVDKLYAHLRMLSDLFGLLGQYTYQINALRLLLPLNNGLRSVRVDFISEFVMITCEIAKVYCTLGYNGKASAEYEIAKGMLAKNKCSAFTELTYLLGYSQYLTSINDFENSKKVFEKAKFVWNYHVENEPKNVQQTSKNYIAKSIILSDAYLAKSMVRSDTLDDGINNTTTALHILNRCLKTFQEDNPSGGIRASDPFSDDKSNKKNEESVSKAIGFKESQWKLAQKLTKCMETVSQLYLTKGSWNEAKYFVSQVINLAQRLQSKSMLHRAYVCSSDFNLRCGNLDKAQSDLEKAFSYKPEGPDGLHDQVYWDISMANLVTSKKMYTEALTLYAKANTALGTLLSSEHITCLEKFSSAKRSLNDTMDVDGKLDCIPISRMQSTNVIQIAAIYGYQGDYAGGIYVLEQLEEAGLSFDEFQFNTTMGHLKLELTLEEISNHDSLKQQDIKCLPAMNYVSRAARRGTQKAEEDVDNNLCILWEKLSNSLQKMMTAFQSGINRERLMAVSRVCNDTGFAIFLKNQIEVKTRNLVNNNAWSSAYYLEMAKGLHARRLTQTCLAEKIQKMHGYLPPSQNTWPSDEPEKPRLNTHSTQGWLQFHLMTLAQHYNKDHLLDDAQFQKEYVDIIPNNWTVCSLTMDPEHNNLYAIQLRAGEAPFVIKLSLDRIIKKLDAGKSFQQVDAELKNIVEESDDTIQYSAQCITPNEIKQWWSKRSSLDLRLKTLLSDVQEWFGGFKGILSGQRNESLDDLKKFCDQLNELVHKIVIKVSIKKAKVEFSLHFCRIILELGQSPSPKELEDVVNFVLSCYEEHSIYIGFDQVGNEITHGLTSLISSYHNNSGRKGINTKKSMPNDHVILILDKYMQTLPMENIPILRKQAVSRLPCLSFLRDRILYAQSKKFTEGKNLSREQNHGNDLHISKKNTFYVLNPSGDLVHTQKEFENLFKSYEDWNGISGTAPIELQCKDALQSKDLYMYFGHSAGQSFLRGTTVRNLSKCAVSLLMGCSSGKMESNGEYDPHGYILNYLVAGSPAVVGNLWDVTDRSIDELTKHMLEKWGVLDKSKGKSLVQAVMESRDKSNLKYLIGAAPVVYGVPVYL